MQVRRTMGTCDGIVDERLTMACKQKAPPCGYLEFLKVACQRISTRGERVTQDDAAITRCMIGRVRSFRKMSATFERRLQTAAPCITPSH